MDNAEQPYRRMTILARLQKNILLIGLVVILAQFLLFMFYTKTQIAPYYPTAMDQLSTYYTIYEAYYAIHDQGLVTAWQTDLAIKPGIFKGLTVPLLGLGLAFLFGPSRESIAITNFIFFVVGQFAVWWFLSRRSGVSSAILGWGLFLLGGTHYFWAGGLDDLRFDYAGMIIFGIAFLILLSGYTVPTAREFWIFLIAFTVAALTRSITIIYLLGTIGLLFLWNGIHWLRHRDVDASRQRLVFFLGLGIAVTLITCIFIWANWHSISMYYINLKVTAEDAIRKDEGGASSLIGLLAYYPQTAVVHFANYLLILLGFTALWLGAFGNNQPVHPLSWYDVRRLLSPFSILLTGMILFSFIAGIAFAISLRLQVYLILASAAMVLGLGWWRWRHTRLSITWRGIREPFASTVVVTNAAVLAFYIAATSYAPSPVVVGVLTIPLVVALTNGLREKWATLLSAQAWASVVVAIAVLGLINYSTAMILPRRFNPAAQADAIVSNQMMADLARIIATRPQTKIYWMFVHPAFTSLGLDIYLYEHNAPARVATLQQISAPIFAATEPVLEQNMARADIVIAFDIIPPKPGFEYPLHTSLRELEPAWRTYLDQHFERQGVFSLANAQGQVGLFVRTQK